MIIVGNLDRLVDACPNIEELHLLFGFFFCNDQTGKAKTPDFFSAIRFDKLKWLTVNRLYLQDGFSFLTVRVVRYPRVNKLEELFLANEYIFKNIYYLFL